MMSSLRADWGTPATLFKTLDAEFHFVLDVCATAETTKCPRWFNKSEDAFTKKWGKEANGRPIWMNPPYGREIGAWVAKACQESRLGATVVCLLPARTDTAWFHDYCLKGEIRLIRGRLSFEGQRKGRAPFPSMIVVFKKMGGGN